MSLAKSTAAHVVAVIGGSTAGAEAAGVLADHGVTVVVFEQNGRPYGKIEDGLPRWHTNLRRKEYDLINSKLDRPGVHFVPSTKIGRDIDFREIVSDWGFTAVILAVGAWRDRPLPIDGADAYIDRGLIYQNAFIYWFNHHLEAAYSGPRYPVADGAIVVGGGLASIDVVKALQIENVRYTLQRRGIDMDMLEIEHAGIPEALARHQLQWTDLGLTPATVFYRRRVEDMPLAEMPNDATPERQVKVGEVRKRIIEKAMAKYCFRTQPLRAPAALLVGIDQLTGLRFGHTRVEDGRAAPIDGRFDDVHAPLIVSSIGSIPEPIPGVPQDGVMYRFSEHDVGRVAGYDNVFAIGNVVTGKGNILTSRRHSIEISSHLTERFLGLGPEGHGGEEILLEEMAGLAESAADRVADVVDQRPAVRPERVEALLAKTRRRQAAVGYTGTYRQWIERVTPPDLG